MSREFSRSDLVRFRRIVCTVVAVVLGTALGLLLAPRSAHAQQKTFYLDRIQIPGGPDDGLVVWRPYVDEKTRFYGAGALGYSLNPLLSDAVTDRPNVQDRIENPVSNQLTMYLTAGAELGEVASASPSRFRSPCCRPAGAIRRRRGWARASSARRSGSTICG